MDQFLIDKEERSKILAKTIPFKEKEYEYDFSFKETNDINLVHSTANLIRLAENDKSIDIEARVLCVTKDGLTHKKIDKNKFIECFKSDRSKYLFKEYDSFGGEDAAAGNAFIGDDYIPLLGGPFNKQMYITDYLRMHAIAFHAWTHDPIARRCVTMLRQFVLGKGFRIDVTSSESSAEHEAILDAIVEVNNLQEQIAHVCDEISIYGEVMIQRIPDNRVNYFYDVKSDQMPAKGLIPRYRLQDPSMCWEIITMPEDINRVIAYQIVAPTQYQIYTAPGVPSVKFIFTQIPADQIMHFKVNSVSNEKRGRSDLVPILGYLKRLRDSVNYQIVADQKLASWAIDTTIKGSQEDISNYISQMASLGEVPPAGSDFVHSDAVTREYLSNNGARSESSSFDWCMNMIAAGFGHPVSYFGMLKSTSQNKASALVGTEPVTKFYEERQLLMEKILRSIIDDALKVLGVKIDYEITFPELITQDRSAKIKDIITVEQQGYISKERAANIIAKELNITEYEYNLEKQKMDEESPSDLDNPLTFAKDKEDKKSGIDSEEKKDFKDNQ